MNTSPHIVSLLTFFRAFVLAALIAFPVVHRLAGTAAQTPVAHQEASPGDLLRWQSIGDVDGYPVWRILYLSTDLDGELIPVSGLIGLPRTPAPANGYPLLAIGHPTAGIARGCAPSLLLYEGSSEISAIYRESLVPYLAAGYAIVMSDFQGLGAAGNPSYVIGPLEGRNILDSIRAVRQFPETALAPETFLLGHSQGGHGVAFAMTLAESYAPEISLNGAVLLAPALDLAGIFEDIMSVNEPGTNSALVLLVFGAWSVTYPEAELDLVATDQGRALVESVVATLCLEAIQTVASLYSPADLFRPDAPVAWAEFLTLNTAQPGHWNAPVFIAHGAADNVIDRRFSEAFVTGLCEAGSTVVYQTYPEAGHFPLIATAEEDVLAWLAGRLSGIPAPSSC